MARQRPFVTVMEPSVKGASLATLLLAGTVPAEPAHQLSFDGIRPVRVGMTVAEAEKALHAKLTVQFPGDNDRTTCGIAYIEGDDQPFSYMIENGQVTRADLGGQGAKSSIRTASGIGLGSTISEIRRAYGERVKSHPNAYEETEPDFEVKSADGKAAMIFETEHGRVVRVHAGRLPSAEYIEGCL